VGSHKGLRELITTESSQCATDSEQKKKGRTEEGQEGEGGGEIDEYRRTFVGLQRISRRGWGVLADATVGVGKNRLT